MPWLKEFSQFSVVKTKLRNCTRLQLLTLIPFLAMLRYDSSIYHNEASVDDDALDEILLSIDSDLSESANMFHV